MSNTKLNGTKILELAVVKKSVDSIFGDYGVLVKVELSEGWIFKKKVVKSVFIDKDLIIDWSSAYKGGTVSMPYLITNMSKSQAEKVIDLIKIQCI